MRRDGNQRRTRAVTIIFAVLLLVFLGRIFYIQAIQSREAKQTAVSSVTVPVEATRGEIRDRNGELLVANKQVRTVIVDFQRFPSGKQAKERNEVLLSLLKLFRAHGAECRRCWRQVLHMGPPRPIDGGEERSEGRMKAGLLAPS